MLSDEILSNILEYLSPPSLHIAATVNTRWSRIAKRLGACRLDFSLHKQQHMSKKEMISYIQNQIPTDISGTRIRHLLIITSDHRLLPNKVFLFIQRLCPNVISFDYDHPIVIPDVKTRQGHPFLSGDSGWRYIKHLPACYRQTEEILWWHNLEFCRRLESLSILDGDALLQQHRGFIEWRTLAPYLPRLDALTLNTPHKINETCINRIHAHDQCPRLTTLTLRDLKLSCQCSEAVPIHHLKNLELQNVTFLNHHTFDYLVAKYPHLETLTFSTTHKNSHVFSFHDDNDDERARLHMGILECLFRMIVRYKHLKKLVVHLKFEKYNPLHLWFKDKIQHYCSSPSSSNQHRIHLEIIRT